MADSAAMLTRREASTPRPSPRCTCLPPRQHCVEVALGGKQVHLGFASEYLLSSSCNFNSSPPRPRPSSPRLRLGELGLGLGGLERSQWVGTSCNFSSSPHPPTVGLILRSRVFFQSLVPITPLSLILTKNAPKRTCLIQGKCTSRWLSEFVAKFSSRPP